MRSYSLAFARLPILFVFTALTVEVINANSSVSGNGRLLRVATLTLDRTSSTLLSMASSSNVVKVNHSSTVKPS